MPRSKDASTISPTKLDRNPAFTALGRIFERFRRGRRADIRNYPVKVMIALRNSHKTTDLADSIASSTDDSDTGRNPLELPNAKQRTRNSPYMAEKRWGHHRETAEAVLSESQVIAPNACVDLRGGEEPTKWLNGAE